MGSCTTAGGGEWDDLGGEIDIGFLAGQLLVAELEIKLTIRRIRRFLPISRNLRGRVRQGLSLFYIHWMNRHNRISQPRRCI